MSEEISNWRRALPSRGQIRSTILRHLTRSQKENSEYEDTLEKSTKIHRVEEEKEIIEKLLNKPGGESSVPLPPVVAITGIAGIGKTTLARLVCEDNRVKDRFGSPIWLNAAAKTFDDIAGSVRQKAVAGGNNRSLLVLDDLRSENWESKLSELRKELVKDGPSVGAIITTTRGTCGSGSSLVDKAMAMHVLPLKGLDEEQSWSLLESLGSCNKEKVEEMRDIVRKCKGVPVAIKLAWTLQEEEAKLSELMLEPPELELLAYVSLFPDDYLIHAQRLLHLWIAEGFGTEEYCRSVFDDFVKFGIFQDVKRKEGNDDAVVKSCRVHPYMQELACFIAKKDGFITTGMADSQLVLRASFDMRSADSVSKLDSFLTNNNKDVRTILFHAMVESSLVLGNHQAERMNEYTCDKLLSTCKEALRVLDLQHLGMNMLPSSIGKLKDLTYLDLSYNNFDKLPNSITKLSQLTTLKLSQCHLLKELPKDLKDLTKLTHLHIDGCVNIQSMPRGISKLTSLQTLSQFVVGKNEPMASHEELKDLNQLKGHLEILYPERLKLQASSSSSKWMDQKEHLRRLTFRFDQHDKGDKENLEGALQVLKPHPSLTVLHFVGYNGDKFPTWIPSLHRLTKLSLYNCATREPLPPLDKLPCLNVLELRRMHSLRFIADECDDNVHEVFRSLKELTLWDCPKLQSWWRNGSKSNSVIFSCISSLRIQYCRKLTRMPLYPLVEMLELVDSSVEPMWDTIHYGESETVSKNCPVSKGLENLKSLIIREIPMLESLPMGLENAKSLQEIKVHDCAGLTSLSEGIGNLTSLVRLEICRCDKLPSLPEAIKQLKSLDTLVIKDCPLLMPRCQPNTGNDWPKISHVKNILVKQTSQDMLGTLRM